MADSDIYALFDEYYNNFYFLIYSFCNAKLNCREQDASDCAQETFEVLLEKLKGGEEILNVRSFLFGTATNILKHKFREIEIQQRRLVPLYEKENDLRYDQIFFGDISQETIIKMKDEIIEALTAKEKELLYFITDLDGSPAVKYKELAEYYSCSETLIRQRVFLLKNKIILMVKEKTADY